MEIGVNTSMMDKLSDREKYGVSAVFAVAIIVSFGAGATVTKNSASGTGTQTSKQQVRQQVQRLVDQQVRSQRQQFKTAANRSQNITMAQLSINSKIEGITQSHFNSLYKVNISVKGVVPKRLGSGTQKLDQNQILYISKDGRYLFRSPTDLQQQQKQPQQPKSQ